MPIKDQEELEGQAQVIAIAFIVRTYIGNSFLKTTFQKYREQTCAM
jgi:hypothetical protein